MNAHARGRLSALSSVCFIHLHGMPHERAVFSSPEGDGGAGGTGTGAGAAAGAAAAAASGAAAGADAPKFSQAQLDQILADRLKKVHAELETTKATAAKVTELEKQLQEQKDAAELAGKSEAEKARIAQEKATAARALELDAEKKAAAAAKAEADTAKAALITHVKSGHITNALVAAKAHGPAIAHAALIFAAEVEITLDDKNAVTAVTYAGLNHKTVAEAAALFLKANPHFLAAAPGGAGTKPPGVGPNGKPLAELPLADLLALDAQQRG